jgi:hypothetical protein
MGLKERRVSKTAALCVLPGKGAGAGVDASKETEEYGSGRIARCNLQGQTAVLIVSAVPEGGPS